jgi:hypothetical protein
MKYYVTKQDGDAWLRQMGFDPTRVESVSIQFDNRNDGKGGVEPYAVVTSFRFKDGKPVVCGDDFSKESITTPLSAGFPNLTGE